MLKTYNASAKAELEALDHNYYLNCGKFHAVGESRVYNSAYEFYYIMRSRELSYELLRDYKRSKSLLSQFKAVSKPYHAAIVSNFQNSLWQDQDNIKNNKFLDVMPIDQDPFAQLNHIDVVSLKLKNVLDGRQIYSEPESEVFVTYGYNDKGLATICFSSLSGPGLDIKGRELKDLLMAFKLETGLSLNKEDAEIFIHLAPELGINDGEQFLKYASNDVDGAGYFVRLDSKPSIIDHMLVNHSQDQFGHVSTDFIKENLDNMNDINYQHAVQTHRRFMVKNNLV